MEREYFIRKMLILGAELGETSDKIKISMIVNDAELLTKKYEAELKKLRVDDVSKSIAKQYTEFCVRCDREGLPLLELDDYIKQYCCITPK